MFTYNDLDVETGLKNTISQIIEEGYNLKIRYKI